MEMPHLSLLEREKTSPSPAPQQAPSQDISMVEWAGQFFRREESIPWGMPSDSGSLSAAPDVAGRRSPIQLYRVPESYRRRRRRRRLLILLTALALILLALGLVHSLLLA